MPGKGLIRFHSVQVKILLPILALLATTSALTVYIFDGHVRRQAFTEAQQTLHTTDAIFQNSLAIRERSLLDRFGTFVREPRFRAVSQLNDVATLNAFLSDTLEQLGDEIEIALYTPFAESIASHASRRPDFNVDAFKQASLVASERALSGNPQASLVFVAPDILNVIAMPVRPVDRGPVKGVLTMGIRLDRTSLNELKSLTQSEVMLHAGKEWMLTTFPASVVALISDDFDTILDSEETAVVPVVIDGFHYHASHGNLKTAEASEKAAYVLLSNYEPLLQALRETRAKLASISLISVLSGALIIFSLVRRITQPLRELRDGAEAVGRGDFDQEIAVTTADECGALATSFNQMTRNVRNSHAKLSTTVKELQNTQEQLLEREATLRNSEEGLRLIVEGARDHVIFTLDRDGKVSRWNHAAHRILGYTTQQAQGLAYEAFFDDDEIAQSSPREKILEAMELGKTNWEGWRIRKDGSRFWADITLSLLPSNGEDRSNGFVEITRDITARKETERAMRAARDAAEASNKAKSEFLANMSHEIRTPMNGIIGMASLLSENGTDEEESNMVETIRHSAESLLLIIDDILDIAKIESGQISVKTTRTPFLPELEAALGVIAPDCGRKGLNLALIIHPSVDTHLMTDTGRLRQVFLNVLSNAVKFTAHGGITVCIQNTLRDEIPCLEIAIEDTGIGIPEASLKEIFEPFRQVDNSTSRSYGGTGLGLAICDQLMTLLGGSIEVTSTEGVGSRFAMIHPRDETTGSADPEKALRKPTLAHDASVLLSIHEASLRAALIRQLNFWGIDVEQSNEPDCDAKDRILLCDAPAWSQIVQSGKSEGLASENAFCCVLPNTPLSSLRGIEPQKITLPLKATLLAEALRSTVKRANSAKQAPGESAGPAFDKSFSEAYPLKILIAEDNPVNAKVLGLMLRRLGYRFDHAINGLKAVEADQSIPYDLILMDLQMPEMDGIEATRQILSTAASRAHTPTIIALTANAHESDRKRCSDAGMAGFLTKPAKIDQIAGAIVETCKERLNGGN